MTVTPEDVRGALRGHVPRALSPEGRRVAAVLVGLLWRGGEPHVLLTRRTEHVRDHRGQIAFPGGHREPDDADAATTALREAHEELGLAPESVEAIGPLDDFHTISTMYHLTPIVGLIHDAPARWTPDEREVAAVMEVPLAHFLEPANRTEYDAGSLVSPAFEWEGQIIWGATAKILIAFADCIRS